MDMRRIAVVDNDRIYLEIIRDLLEDEGYTVLTHDDLRTGCSFVRQVRPDLVIVDILQQRKPLGLTLLADLLQDPLTRDVPVIVVSADEFILKDYATQFHADGFQILGKPFQVQDLLAVISDGLRVSMTSAAVTDRG
jgi:CheY-like chemotaxis protein